MKRTTTKIDDPILQKRVKLLPCQKEMVEYRFKEGHSIKSISEMFSVSRRTIQFILFPERLKKNIELREERGGSKAYYKTDKHTEYMRRHRAYKKELFNGG